MAYINGKKVLTAIKTVMAPASLQEKRITPTTFEKEVVADSGYDGLSKVKLSGVLVDTHQTLESTQDGSVAYTKTVPAGALPYASIDMLGGMSYKYNQLATITNSRTEYGLTITNNNDGSLSISGTYDGTASYNQVTISTYRNFKRDGTKYLFLINKDLGCPIGLGGYGGQNNRYFFFSDTNDTDWSSHFIILPTSGLTINATDIIISIVDLTAMYGAGNEPTTVEQFLADNPMYNAYVPYTEGDIINANVTSIDSIGVNIWDEEWEKGWIDLNGDLRDADNVRCKDFIKVFPNTTYYVKNGGNGTFIWLQYDENKNFIPNTRIASTNTTFTTLNNCHYIKFHMGDAYGATYNHDVCINVSNDAINGTYFPYFSYTFPIPSSIQELDGYGWGVNDSLYNYIDFERKKFVKKVGRVDLGTLNWTYVSGSGYFYTKLEDKVASSTRNVLCPKYSYKYYYSDGSHDKTIADSAEHTEKEIGIFDSAYTDATTFKTAMSGVYLYYELATPVITDLSNILTDDNFIEVEPYGTLTFENTNKKAVPSKIAYLVEVK